VIWKLCSRSGLKCLYSRGALLADSTQPSGKDKTPIPCVRAIQLRLWPAGWGLEAMVITSGLEPLFRPRSCAAIRSHCVRFLFCYRFKQRASGVPVMRSISKRLAFVCLLLTIWSAIAFVVHQHSSATEAAKCTVCVAAHSASPKTTSNLQKAAFVALSTVHAQPVSAKHHLVAFALSVRPPPEV